MRQRPNLRRAPLSLRHRARVVCGVCTCVMPPRRSARVAAVAERATTALPPLPLSVVLYIFSLLPVDCRLRCLEVCRGWRSVLSERSLWTRLELTAESGVRVRVLQNADSLLRCAAARAGGGLQSLQVEKAHVTHAALLHVAAANAGALCELHAHSDLVHKGCAPAEVEALLGAAPLLRTFATDLFCYDHDVQAACRALRNEAPFGPLRVQRLHACLYSILSPEDEADVIALAAGVTVHASLEELILVTASLNTAAALDAVVDAALVRGIVDCGEPP